VLQKYEPSLFHYYFISSLFLFFLMRIKKNSEDSEGRSFLSLPNRLKVPSIFTKNSEGIVKIVRVFRITSTASIRSTVLSSGHRVGLFTSPSFAAHFPSTITAIQPDAHHEVCMTDLELIETLGKFLGVPGVLLFLGIWTIRTLTPVWRDHLKEQRKHLETNNTLIQSVTTTMSALTQGILEWHKLHDIRLSRIENQTNETSDDILNLYGILDVERPRRRRLDQPKSKREAQP
jgi:hypothetical protein